MFDLHVHTSASDGLCSPEQVVQEAVELRLEGLALTDHDTVNGIEPARAYIEAHRCPLTLIPGIEMNTEGGSHEIHVLGYFIDHHNDRLLTRLQELKESRQERSQRMVKLNTMGFDIRVERVVELARGDVMGRPHIARALIEKGYVFSTREAFDKLIGYGKPGYVARYKFTPEEAIELIKVAGGAPVLAHPGLLRDDGLVEHLLSLGVEGIEVYYPEHSEEETQRYFNLACRKGLLVTGGSDYHGNPEEYHGKLGCAVVEREAIKALQRRAEWLRHQIVCKPT